MKKKQRHSSAIPGKAWLALKPYDKFTPYDQFYVKLASSLKETLKVYQDFFSQHIGMPDGAEKLALILTSYFEDIVNEIGIWQAFVETNHDQLGYYLPFMEEEDEEIEYEPGTLDYRDLRYLVWHFFNKAKQSYFAPDSMVIEVFAEIAWEVFEPALYDAPETDFYEDFLTIPDDADFFAVKKRLQWFALASYALGPEFTPSITRAYQEMIKERPHMAGSSEVLHQIMDDYLFIKASSFCSLTALQWFVKVADVSPEMKETILYARNRLTGMFEYLGANDDYYQARYERKEEILQLVKKSVDIPAKTKPGTWLFMNLVSFRGEFWMSGLIMSYGELKEREITDTPLPFFMQSEETKQLAQESTEKMEADFRAEFGDLVYISTDLEDMKARLRGFWTINRERIATENPDEPLPPLDEALLSTMYAGIPDEPGTAAVFVPGEGMLFEPYAGLLQNMLNQEGPLDAEARQKLFFGLAAETHPVTLAYLLKHSQERPIIFPAEQSEIDVRPFMHFFSRYIQPESYQPRVPHVQIVG